MTLALQEGQETMPWPLTGAQQVPSPEFAASVGLRSVIFVQLRPH